MSFEEAEPTRIVKIREPRERGEKLDFEELIGPAIAIGALVGIAYYKEPIATFLKDIADKVGASKLTDAVDKILHPDVKPLPPVDTGGGGGGGSGGGGGGGTITGGSTDSNGIKIPYKLTGKNVKMNYGARHPNGDRYNANHAFQNYYVVGYYLTQSGSGKRLIEMKTDGPNHSGCTSLPKCEWVELDFDISSGQPYISSEYPHPQNHPPTTSGVTINKPSGSFGNKYVGFGVAAWTGTDGYRIYEEWIDPGGLSGSTPANKWVRTLHAKNTGQIIPNPKRTLPTSGRGLEAEIRMNNQHSTQMKFGTIHEIQPLSSSNLARVNAYYDRITLA